MAKGIKRRLRDAQLNVASEIFAISSRADKFARGLSVEGYLGGYQAALSDVSLLLDGVEPCVRPDLWRKSTAKTLEETLRAREAGK